MPFVKLDCGILDSSIWLDRPAREVFLTALLMAEPCVLDDFTPQIEVRSLRHTNFAVPAGCYGFVKASGSGIIRRAGLVDIEEGLSALERLGSPENESRSHDWEGRRLVRVDGGYIVLNFDKYRKRDITAAERMRRYREKQKGDGVTRNARNERRNVTVPSASASASASASKLDNKDLGNEGNLPDLFNDDVPDLDPNRKKDLAAVVEFYLSTHPKRRVVNETGRQKVRTRLAEGFTVDNLENAIRGNAMDPWHVDKGKHGLEYVLRNPDMVNDFIGKYEQTRKPRSRSDDLPLLNAGAE